MIDYLVGFISCFIFIKMILPFILWIIEACRDKAYQEKCERFDKRHPEMNGIF